MARQCPICNQSYPENLWTCPHCNAVNPHPRLAPLEDEAVDLGQPPLAQESDSSPSAQALEALLAETIEGVVEITPEPGSGIRQRPQTDVNLPAGVIDITEEPTGHRQAPATDVHLTGGVEDVSAKPDSGKVKRPQTDVDLHDVIEDVREEGSGAKDRPATGVDLYATVDNVVEIVAETTPGTQTSAPSALGEAEHVIEIFPERSAGAPGESAIDIEPIVVEPVSSTSGSIPMAESAESPSAIVALTGPEHEGLSEPSRSAEEEAAAILDLDAITVEPASSPSGSVYVAEDAEAPSGILMVAGTEPEAGAPAAPAGEAAFVAGVPNLELESKIHHVDVAAEADDAVVEVVEVAESASGSMPPPGAERTIAEDTAGALDEEILDVTEEASSASLSGTPASGQQPAAPASGEVHSDVLDAEEVVEAAEASGVDIFAETLESGVGLSGKTSPSGRKRTSEVDLGGEAEEVEAISSGVDLAAPVAGGSSKKHGSSPVLDDKSIEDLLMGPEKVAGGPPSSRIEAHEVVHEQPAAEEELLDAEPAEADAEAAAEEEKPSAPAKAKEGAWPTTPKAQQALYVGGGVLAGILLFVVLAGAFWFVATDSAMSLLGVQKKQPPPPPPPAIQVAHDLMDRGNYAQAVSQLQSAGNRPDVQSARAQAHWLKYLQENKNKKLDPSNPDVAKALEDAQAAKNDALTQQIQAALRAQQDRALLAQSDKTMKALQQAVPGAKSAKDLPQAVATLVKEKDKAEKEVQALAETKQVVGALATQLKVKPQAVAKTVADLVAARTALDASLKEIDEKLKSAKIDDEGPAGVAKLVETRNKLAEELTLVNNAVNAAFGMLKAENLTPPGADPRQGLIEATKRALVKARTPLVISQNPEQKLDTWIALLQDRSHNDASYVKVAQDDAQVVLASPRASAESKAKAQYILGLADRNKGQFDQARQALDRAVKAAAAAKAAWAKNAGETLRELTDTTAYYLPRAQRLVASGDLKAALADLDSAVQVSPEDGRLRALRGQVRLEMLPAGKLDPATQTSIRQDAEAARKDPRTAAEGSYVLGRLDEEMNNFGAAEKHYRTALESHKGSPDEASRYIIALARVLQRERGAAPEAPPAPEPQPKPRDAKEPKAGQQPAQPPDDAQNQISAADPRLLLLAAALIGFQPAEDEEDPATAARLRESIELAKRLINSADPKVKGQGYMLWGQALARQGKRTDGLQLYTKGMQLAYPGAATKELSRLVEENPAFQQTERPGTPNSFLAERSFGKGLHAFWSGQYAAAEDEFGKAVAQYDQDARYQYYLGLSRLLQDTKAKRQQARHNFETGARLEAENRPGPRIVNASLERLQGQLRYYLDEYRQKGP